MTTVNSKWKIDPGHSHVQFKVKHLAIANINGVFKTFEGNVEATGEDFDKAKVTFLVDANSIDTQHPDRDAHFKSPDFFDVQQYPEIRFNGELEKEGEDYSLNGDLTIHGISHNVKLAVELSGMGKGRFGDERAGFEVSGKINRKDFGLTWNILVDGGGLVLGDDIKLHFDIELIKQ